ncbi:hypothetical protein, partial [Acinetobacter baumannii]|uniref:hypothetical protein n=1 Tax=Acinetobacter baumannii TaxID=470 RepID=UPI00148F02A6
KYPAYKPKLSPQSFCEGIEWYSNEEVEFVIIDGNKKLIKELDSSVDTRNLNRLKEEVSIRKVKCRRHGCNACTPDLLNESIFYQLLHQVKFKPTVLHKSGSN